MRTRGLSLRVGHPEGREVLFAGMLATGWSVDGVPSETERYAAAEATRQNEPELSQRLPRWRS
jgi:hypothetical protein